MALEEAVVDRRIAKYLLEWQRGQHKWTESLRPRASA